VLRRAAHRPVPATAEILQSVYVRGHPGWLVAFQGSIADVLAFHSRQGGWGLPAVARAPCGYISAVDGAVQISRRNYS
jgi:hypothetical protein